MREDGKIFLAYHRQRIAGERWGTKEQWDAEKTYSTFQNKRLRGTGYTAKKSREQRLRRKLRADPEETNKWREYHRAYYKKWLTRARSRMYAWRHVPRAQARGHFHPEKNTALVLSIYQKAVDMSASEGKQYVVDHIIPIKHGGWTHELNLQILPSRVNHLKQAMPFWTSDIYLDWRDVPEFLWPEKLAPVYRTLLGRLGRPLKLKLPDSNG